MEEYSWDDLANQSAKQILEPNGEMSQSSSIMLRDILELSPQFQTMFLYGDKGDQAQAIDNVAKLNHKINNFKGQRKANASLWMNQNTPNRPLNVNGYSIGLQDDEEARTILGSHNGEDVMDFAVNVDQYDEPVGFDIGFRNYDNSLMSPEDAASLSNKFTVDTNSAKKILDLRNLLSNEAKNGSHEDIFNTSDVRRAVNSIIKRGKQISLMYDPLVKDTSFREDLISSGYLSNITYESLGLNPKKIKTLDRDNDGFINPSNDGLSVRDQMALASRFMKHPDLENERNELLTDYFTQFIRQEWDSQHQVHVHKASKARAKALVRSQVRPAARIIPQKRKIG